MSISLDDIRAAAKLIEGQVLRTPLTPAPKLSAMTGAQVFVKYENLQVTNAFKERGALVCLSRLPEAAKRRGVIAMSAGNHAQAVAYHAARLGIQATIVMPSTTPFVKVANTEAHGARVVLDGESLQEARAVAARLAEEQGLTFVHPYDDADIIAGQGTVALEMLEQRPDLDCLVVPIGGGGLIAGVATAAKGVAPDIEIVGVEPQLYPSMHAAINGIKAQCGGQTLAEGIAVRDVGTLAVPIVKALVKEIVTVPESAIERAVNAFLTHQKTTAEGAGAAGLAAMFERPELFAGRNVGLILCGGNIDPRILASIVIRELEREDRIVSFRIATRDRPGELGRIATLLGEAGANILEVAHNRLFLDVPAKGASVDITVETRSAEHAREIFEALRAAGYPPKRLARLAEAS
jgi:threonine dehydratase